MNVVIKCIGGLVAGLLPACWILIVVTQLLTIWPMDITSKVISKYQEGFFYCTLLIQVGLEKIPKWQNTCCSSQEWEIKDWLNSRYLDNLQQAKLQMMKHSSKITDRLSYGDEIKLDLHLQLAKELSDFVPYSLLSTVPNSQTLWICSIQRVFRWGAHKAGGLLHPLEIPDGKLNRTSEYAETHEYLLAWLYGSCIQWEFTRRLSRMWSKMGTQLIHQECH